METRQDRQGEKEENTREKEKEKEEGKERNKKNKKKPIRFDRETKKSEVGEWKKVKRVRRW